MTNYMMNKCEVMAKEGESEEEKQSKGVSEKFKGAIKKFNDNYLMKWVKMC